MARREDRPPSSEERAAENETDVPALIARAREGDRFAFEGIYRAYAGRIYGLVLRLVADPVEAETLTQDVFIRVWRKLGSYRGTGSFEGWLRRVAVNTTIENRRSRTRRLRVETPEETAPDRASSRPSHAGRTEIRIDLERAMETLPEKAREVFVLHDVEGYKHEEIAAMTGTAVGTTKAQLHRARRLLREALGGR